MNDYMEKTSKFIFKVNPVNGWLVGPTGCDHPNEADAMYYGQVDMCGCGSPAEVHEFIIKCLSAKNDKYEQLIDLDKVAEIINDNSEVAAQFLLHSLGNSHLVEHGGSVYGSWLTKRGQQFIDIGPINEDEDMSV